MPPSGDATQGTPLAPSVEKAYYRKCIELKRRLNEVEEANDAARLRKLRLTRAIMKMRLERAFLLDQLAKRMDFEDDDKEPQETREESPSQPTPAAKTTTAKKDISTSTAKKTTSTPTRGHTQPAARQLESAPGMAPPSVYNMTHVPQTWPPHYYASGPRQYSSTGHIPHTLSPMQQQPTPFPLHYQSPNSRRFQLRIDTYRNPVPTGHYTFSPTSTIQPGYRRQVNTSPTSPIRPEYHNPYNTGAISPIQPGHHSPYNASATSPNQSGHLPFGHAQVRQTLSHHISPPGRAPAIDPRGTAMSPTFHRNHARSGSVQGSNGRPRNAHSHLRSSRAGRGQRQTRQ